jgi:hypothetical protein
MCPKNITLKQVNFPYFESQRYMQKTLYFPYLKGNRLAKTYLLGYLLNSGAETLMVPYQKTNPGPWLIDRKAN